MSPRVTGAKTRQAILVLDSIADPNQLPEHLALFDHLGNPINIESSIGLPEGGGPQQLLAKVSADNFDVEWVDLDFGPSGPAGSQLLDEGVLRPLQPFWDLVGAGVSVTDDPTNGKSIISIPGGMAGSDIKAILAALASADKLAWEASGADFAEIYGELVATGWSTTLFDTFNTDTSANYVVTRWTGQSIVAPIYTVVSGTLKDQGGSQTGSHTLQFSQLASTPYNYRVRTKHRHGTGSSDYADSQGPALILTPQELLMASFEGGWPQSSGLRIHKVENGVLTQLVTGGIVNYPNGTTSGAYAWVELEKNGNILTAKYWNSDPDGGSPSLLQTVTHTLAAGNATKYGTGISLQPGYANRGNQTNQIDEIKVQAQLPEQRDLWVAVTSDAGSLRTARRLLRKDGLSEIGHTILDGLVAKNQRPKLAFSGLSVVDDSANERTTVSTLKYAADLGAITAATPLTVTHNLNTKDVAVTVYRISDGEELVVTSTRTSVNAVQLTFAASFAAGVYRVVVRG